MRDIVHVSEQTKNVQPKQPVKRHICFCELCAPWLDLVMGEEPSNSNQESQQETAAPYARTAAEPVAA